MRILIIDDDPDTGKLFCTIVDTEGHETVGAYSGAEGLEVANEQQPDLIVLDVMMPEMDGWEVLGRLRHDKSTEKIPVVVWSAMTGHRNEEMADELGAQAYVRKGCGLPSLLEVIKGFGTSSSIQDPAGSGR
jgi:CheY-like chemotaxis protein